MASRLRLREYVSKTWMHLKSSAIARQMAAGAFWSLTGTGLAKAIALVSGVVCARILGKTGYGEFGIIRSTINMFVVLGSAGLGLTATKFIAEYKKSDKQKTASIYSVTALSVGIAGILAAAAILVLAPYIAEKSLNALYLSTEIRIGSLLLFVTILNSVQNGALADFEDFRAIAVNAFSAGLVEAVLMNAGAQWFGVRGAILGFGTGYLVLLAINSMAVRRNFKAHDIQISIRCIKIKDIKVLYQFSLPAALSGIMVAPVFWFAKSILVKTAGFGAVGLFDAADQWRVMILFIPSILAQIILPLLPGTKNKENSQFWKVVKYNLLINGIISLFLASCVSFYAGFIMRLYGPEFDNALPFVFLAVSSVFSAVAGVAGQILASRSKMWQALCLNLLWAVLLIVFSYGFIKSGMGATGLALAVCCSYFIFSVIIIAYMFLESQRDRIHSNIR